MDRRAVMRVAALTALAAGVLTLALHLDRPRPETDGADTAAQLLPAVAAVPAATGTTTTGATGARARLERGLARPATGSSATTGPGAAAVDESRPHRHVVDPETGGLISLAGAGKVFPDARDLGPLHLDPMPPGVSLSDPTDTRSLLQRAGDVQATLAGDQPFAAAATAPIGTPTIATLTQHVVPSCSGTGTDGNRVQVLYVHQASTPSRFTAVLPVLRQAVADVDDVFAVSARQTGGERRVRWVHDADCLPVITSVTVPDGSLGVSFSQTVSAVQALGYDHADRKYLMFADAKQLCGIGSMYDDARLTGNANNGRYASYARVDTSCWSSTTSVPAHELTHTLGGVLSTAPHATKYGHCYDDSDLMCYDDGSGIAMKKVCASAQEQLLDCNHDDYFDTSPAAGSFLAGSWNTASSSFLDRVLNDVPPPDVAVTASTATAQTGDHVTLTATSSKTVSWTWSKPTAAAACTLTPGVTSGTTGTATLLCPAGVTGDVVVTATATQAGANGTGSARATVAMTRAAAPTATVSAPAAGTPGEALPLTVTAVGKAPFSYAWTGSPCTVAAPAQPTTTLTCPPGTATQDVPVSVVVTQADGQTIRRDATVAITGTTAPLATGWSTPTLRSGVLSAVLQAGSTPLAGRAVTLQAQWFGTSEWVIYRETTTSSTGLATASTRADRAGSFRFAAPADPTHAASTSASGFVKVGTRTTAGRPSSHRVAGALQTLGGQRVAGQPVTLQARRAGTTRWVSVVRLRTDTRGAVGRSVYPRHRTYYRWVFGGSTEHAASRSASVRVG